MELIDIRVLGCTGLLNSKSSACTVYHQENLLLHIKSLSLELCKPSICISKSNGPLKFTITQFQSHTLSVIVPVSLLTTGKVWIPLFSQEKEINSLDMNTSEKLLIINNGLPV